MRVSLGFYLRNRNGEGLTLGAYALKNPKSYNVDDDKNNSIYISKLVSF